ncbi:hypothetical protein H6F86_07000 [Phormidium sp. FACHB-592]|uniref:DUF6644 domain-containing protein n=1 Tax=Stenomitos frigidus AS-A4 TaxID=2933935 RepID=A0ABV0KI72_9CYAN|nr:DUF6644 family protein [Phormidium sp. FACHB-592]MBD2073641.1 hypothetical protein [Phormidium sp. FACHB-592]
MLLAVSSWLWLEQSVLSHTIRQWLWLYPAIESLHLLGLALLFGSIVMFDLRLLGFSRQLWITDMAWHLLPWAYLGFAIAAVTGFLLFAVDANQLATNPAFRLKLLLITATGINAALFHFHYRSVRLWNRGVVTPWTVRAIAVVSLLLWVAVIICGRLIAYI